MNKLLLTLAFLYVFCAAPHALCVEEARVTSIPFAISQEHIYKIRVDRIDGEPVSERRVYSLSPGVHELEVSLILHIQWENAEGPVKLLPMSKNLTLELVSGKQYELAGRVNLDATEEQVAAGNYWEPMVYRSQVAQ